MRFRNSLHLLMENFKHVFKLLLYKIIIAVLAGSLCVAFVLPEIREIVGSDIVSKLTTAGKNFFKSLVYWENGLDPAANYLRAIFGDKGNEGLLHELWTLIVSMRTEIILACVGMLLVYLVIRFVDTLFYFAIGSTINDKMSTYADTPFSMAFIANLGKACRYAALYVPIVFLFDACTIALCCLFLTTFPLVAGLFSAFTLIVVFQSFKLTFTGPWMPAMTTDERPLREAIRYTNKREKQQVAKAFATYVVTVYIVIIVNVVAAVCTFGSALLISVPASYLLFICQQYVHYYTMKGKDYFITYDGVATNPDYGDSEHFFEYIEEQEKAQKAETQADDARESDETAQENNETNI